jgi:hypothetical protein
MDAQQQKKPRYEQQGAQYPDHDITTLNRPTEAAGAPFSNRVMAKLSDMPPI